MVSTELLGYCVLAGGVYLLVISGLLELAGKGLNVSRGLPETLVEKLNASWFVMTFVIELMFFVVIPSLAFGFFHIVLPLASVRTGLAVALCAFTLGALPLVMGMSVRLKLPIPFLVFSLLALLVKVSGTLAIIGYLYSL